MAPVNNNTIDKFGRSGRTNDIQKYRGLPGIGFQLTSDNKHFDIQNRRLTQVGEPMHENDAATQKYVKKCIEEIADSLHAAIEQSTKKCMDMIQKRLDRDIAAIQLSVQLNEHLLRNEMKVAEDNWEKSVFSKVQKRIEEKIEIAKTYNIEHTQLLLHKRIEDMKVVFSKKIEDLEKKITRNSSR